MSIWIWPVTQENWPIVKSKKVWAVNTLGKGKKVEKGHKIIFYVNGTLYCHGIFEVISDWHESTIQWPDTSRPKDSAAEINLKEIQLGYASVHKLLPSLNFIEKKKDGLLGLYLRGTPMGPANSAKPISEEDYTLIFEELKSVQTEPNFKKEKEKTNESDILVDLPDISFEIVKIPTPDKKSISNIYQDADQGKFAIPDFQRVWTWNRGQIEELWESIFRGYYIGSLLIWDGRGKDLGSNPVQGAAKLSEHPDMILDGQQRTNAIYYALKAPELSLPNTDHPYVFFLNINAFLDQDRPTTDIVSSFRAKKAKKLGLFEQEIQFRKKLFPLTELNDKKYTKWLFEFNDYLIEKEGYEKILARKYYETLDTAFNYVWSHFEIPIVRLPESLSLDNVVEVFERINSKGTRLDVFDLLNARFKIHDIVLRTLWQQTLDKHENILTWFEKFKNEKLPQYVLQAMSLYKTGYARRRYLLRIDESYTISGKFNKEGFEEDWQEMSKYVEDAIQRLVSVGLQGFGAVNYDFIPYTTMVPILAALLKIVDKKDDRPKCLDKISFWYWNNVVDDVYSGSTDSTMESDLKEMKFWFEDDQNRISPQAINDDFPRAKSNSAIYKAIMCLIAKEGALDFIRNDPPEFSKLEDHHIFPKSKATKFNTQDLTDSILNRTLIFEKTNRYITNKDPSVYITEIMNEQKISKEKMKERLATHLISSDAFDCMLNDDFKGFVKAREKTIQEKLEIALKLKI